MDRTARAVDNPRAFCLRLRGLRAVRLHTRYWLFHADATVKKPLPGQPHRPFFQPAVVDNCSKIVDKLTEHVETLPRSAGNIRIYAEIAIFYPPYLGDT